MNWIPHFLSPGFAAAAAAIAVPSLLVLYFLKLRRREMPVSSTFLWRKAVQDLQVNAPFQRLRRNLLLLLQLLALLALIIALARPVANYTPGAGRLSVILIDRSASMSAADMSGGRTRLDEAKRLASDLVDGMERGGQATVIAFDDEPEVVQTFTGDAEVLRNAIKSIQTTDRSTKLKLAFQLAGAQAAHLVEQNTGVKPTVYLYSDGRVADATELSLDGDLKYQPIGTDTAGNIAVVAMDAKRNYDNPVQVQVFARLANYGPRPLAADVQLTIDDKLTKVARVQLAPERWNDPAWTRAHPGERDEKFNAVPGVEFTVDMPNAGVVRVEQVAKGGDLLAADDAAAVVVPPPKDLSVLLVTAAHDNPYLERAFASMGLKIQQTMLAEEYEDKRPTNFDVVIFDRYTPDWTPASAPSGSFIWFGCAPPVGKLGVAKVGEKYETVGSVGVLDWQRDHPILKHLQVGDLFAASMLKLNVPPDAQVLVDGIKGPMVVLDRETAHFADHDWRATNLVVAFDLLQSNWPLHRVSFPLFVHYALQFMALGSDMAVRPDYPPGSTPRVPHVVVDHLAPGLRSIRLDGPMGSIDVPIPATGDFVFPALNKVGVYRTDPPVPQFEQMAVNLLDPNESNLMPVLTPPGNVTASNNAAVATAGGHGRLELWWWLVACGAVPALMVEWWVYTRRVHL
jgi:hypothetical protein